jgi:hypothetical protein
MGETPGTVGARKMQEIQESPRRTKHSKGMCDATARANFIQAAFTKSALFNQLSHAAMPKLFWRNAAILSMNSAQIEPHFDD